LRSRKYPAGGAFVAKQKTEKGALMTAGDITLAHRLAHTLKSNARQIEKYNFKLAAQTLAELKNRM